METNLSKTCWLAACQQQLADQECQTYLEYAFEYHTADHAGVQTPHRQPSLQSQRQLGEFTIQVLALGCTA